MTTWLHEPQITFAGELSSESRARLTETLLAAARRAMATIDGDVVEPANGSRTGPAAEAMDWGRYDRQTASYRVPSYDGDGGTVTVSVEPSAGAPPAPGTIAPREFSLVGAAPSWPSASGTFTPSTPAATRYRDIVLLADAPQLRYQLRRLMIAEGRSGPPRFVHGLEGRLRTAKSNASDYSGVTPEVEELWAQIARDEAILPLLREQADLLDQKAQDFLSLFELKARLLVQGMLDVSEQRVQSEKLRYGLGVTEKWVRRPTRGDFGESTTVDELKSTYWMAANDDTGRLATAAAALIVIARRLRAKLVEKNSLVNPWLATEFSKPDDVITDKPRYAALTAEVDAIKREYDVLRFEKAAEFPIIASFTEIGELAYYYIDRTISRLQLIATGAPAEMLYQKSRAVLKDIEKVRGDLASGDLKVWTLNPIVELTKKELGVQPGSLEARLVADQVASVGAFRRNLEMVLGVLAFALGILAAPLTGGASLTLSAAVVAGTAAVGTVAISGYLAYQHLQDYLIESALHGTDFDKARAISQEEPTLFWLALDLVSIAFDLHGALGAFRSLRSVVRETIALRRAALTAEEVAKAKAEVERVAQEAKQLADQSGKNGEALASALRRDLEAEAAKAAAEAKGAASRWLKELDPETMKWLEQHEEVAAVFRQMDGETRQLLTLCDSLKVPRDVAMGRAGRVRKLLDQLGPRDREGLEQFLKASKNDLDAALSEAEKLHEELALAVQEIKDAIDSGQTLRRGDLLRASRKGAAANVPDIIGGKAGQKISTELIEKVHAIIGRRIADAEPAVVDAWNRAVKRVLDANKEPLTRELMNGTLYPAAQKRFWIEVRQNETAKAFFQKQGFILREGSEGAPLIEAIKDFPGQEKEFSISLDHILEKAQGDNWKKALDADNLRFVTFWDNWLLAQINLILRKVAP